MAKRSRNTDRPTKRGERIRSDGYKRSKQQQKRVDETLGADRVPGSGAPSCAAGDSRLPGILQENKTTKGAGIYIQGPWLIKITDEALCRGKDPALCFTVEGLSGKMTESGFPVEDTWVAVPLSVYKYRLEHVDNEDIC